MSESPEVDEFLSHYGVVGMRWGKHKAGSGDGTTRKERRQIQNDQIKTARENQNVRKSELKDLTQKRLKEKSSEGKAFLDSKIVDKKFEINNHPDAETAAKRTTGEKWLKAGSTAAIIGLSVVGLGSAGNAAGNAFKEATGRMNDNLGIEDGYDPPDD